MLFSIIFVTICFIVQFVFLVLFRLTIHESKQLAKKHEKYLAEYKTYRQASDEYLADLQADYFKTTGQQLPYIPKN